MNKTLIITVNYKNTVVTKNFVHSLEKLDHSDTVELVIVDSASTPETKKSLQILQQQTALENLFLKKILIIKFQKFLEKWQRKLKNLFFKTKGFH